MFTIPLIYRNPDKALTLGIPIARHLGEIYMKKFSERVDLSSWHYALPLLGFVFILLCSVATVVWKAARNNPVDALKDE